LYTVTFDQHQIKLLSVSLLTLGLLYMLRPIVIGNIIRCTATFDQHQIKLIRHTHTRHKQYNK